VQTDQGNAVPGMDSADNGQWHGGLERELTATAAWSRMLAGNHRFAEGKAEHPWQDRETRESLIDVQTPDAAVLSCSDSRVPPEIIFDEGLGDLFTIRSAGQTLDDAVVSSIEFALNALHVSLIVVLGHQNCGAVAAAVKELETLDHACDSDSIIVRSVGASVEQARQAELDTPQDFERVHVARTIEELVSRSQDIRRALAQEKVMIVGARYKLTTGNVEVLSF
jgi:carbonic anhydrase